MQLLYKPLFEKIALCLELFLLNLEIYFINLVLYVLGGRNLNNMLFHSFELALVFRILLFYFFSVPGVRFLHLKFS